MLLVGAASKLAVCASEPLPAATLPFVVCFLQQAKELQASLKHKRATEAALRDELRRALAGEGLTPNPAAPPGARSPAGARQRPAGAAGTVRSSSMRLRQQQQQSPAQQHSKRLGSMLSPSDQSAQKVVVRAAPWEQPEGAGARHAAAFSAKFGSQTRVGMQQQQQQQSHGAFSSSTNGRTPAKLSRIDRLGQLSEQRRGRQLPDLDSQPLLRPAAAGASASAGLEQQQTYGARQQGCEGMCGLLSPPSTASRPVASQAAPGLPAASRQELLKLRVPSVAEIPLQDGQLMRVYASALDEQIAALETDLQALEASGAPSPVTHLQLLAKAGASPAAAGPAGGQKQQAAAALKSPGECIAPVPLQQKPDQAHAAAAAAAISAWRPNSVFNAAVQQLGSPDAVAPAISGSPTRLSPAGKQRCCLFSPGWTSCRTTMQPAPHTPNSCIPCRAPPPCLCSVAQQPPCQFSTKAATPDARYPRGGR
jgi:hypothetical protein